MPEIMNGAYLIKKPEKYTTGANTVRKGWRHIEANPASEKLKPTLYDANNSAVTDWLWSFILVKYKLNAIVQDFQYEIKDIGITLLHVDPSGTTMDTLESEKTFTHKTSNQKSWENSHSKSTRETKKDSMDVTISPFSKLTLTSICTYKTVELPSLLKFTSQLLAYLL